MAATDRYAYFAMAVCFIVTVALVWAGASWTTCLIVAAIGFAAYATVSLMNAAIVFALRRNARVREAVFPLLGVGTSAAMGVFPSGLIAGAIQALRAAM